MKEWNDNSSVVDGWQCDKCGADYHMTALIICNIVEDDLCQQYQRAILIMKKGSNYKPTKIILKNND